MTAPDPALVAHVTAAVEQRGARRNGIELRTRCVEPARHAHGDAHPSLRWHPDRGVWRCAVCGLGGGAIDLARRLGVELPPRAVADTRETTWTVRDAAGRPVAVHVRLDAPGQPKRYVWRRPDGRTGLGGLRAADLPLYGGERLAALDPATPVVVTEGERACDALTARGIGAVGTVTGASGTPSDDVLRVLVGRAVVLWPDADPPGRTHMARIAARLAAHGCAVRWCDPWPDASDGRDAADYAGATEELRAALDAAPAWGPAAEAAPPVGVLLVEVQAEPVDWLWPGKLARGKLAILEGRPDEGKTTVALDLAARVSTGAAMPGEPTRREPAGVVVVTAEDGLADTVRPRLEAAGADCARIVAPRVDEVLSLDPAGLAWLREACKRVNARLVILDPLVALMPGAVDAHRDQDVRRMLRPLRAFAEESGVAVLAIRHLRKAAAASPKDAGGGSVGIGAAARVVMLAAPDPDDAERRVLARVKGNLAAAWPALAYRLVPAGASVRVDWLGASPHTAEALLAAATETDEPGALDTAVALVRELLAGGAVPSTDLDRAARASGIAGRTLERARARLGVRAEKVGTRWLVRLPREVRHIPPRDGDGALGGLGGLEPVEVFRP
ncbi:MAG: AAA family ATPase [Candidatus Binatia bacterium]